MARINLLPWRQEERLRKNQEFNVLAGAAAALSILVVLLAMAFLNNELSNQEAANEKIKAENARLDGVIAEISDLEKQRDDMLSRMKVIQDLQGRRSIPVRVWDDIARATPNSAYLVGIKRERDLITITGFAADNNVVAEFVRNLDASPWLGGSVVPNIKTSVEAYAPPPSLREQKSGQPRDPLPEDSYISFTIATQVASGEVIAEANNPADGSAANAQTSAPMPPAEQTSSVPAAQPASAQPIQDQSAQAQPNAQPVQGQPVQGQPDPAQTQPNAQPVQSTTQSEPAPSQGQANAQPVGGQ